MLPLKFKENTSGVLVFGGESKKEGVRGLELARGRVSKFYWWVAIRSRAWGLVSLIV